MRHLRWIDCGAAAALLATACSSGPGDGTGRSSAAAKGSPAASGVDDAGMMPPPPPPDDAGKPPPPPMDAGLMSADAGCDPGQGACMSLTVGDGKTCVDLGTLKQEAMNACAALMEQLTDLQPILSCCDDSASLAAVECCAPQPPPPPPPPPPGCVDLMLVGNGCLDPSTLKQDASDLCTKLGMDLTGLEPEGAGPMCPAGTSAVVECCPPAPPPKCVDETIGDGKTCLDETTLKEQAVALCAKVGLPVTSISLEYSDGGCPTLASVSCCGS